METAPLKLFATWARAELIREVGARIAAVLAPGSSERVEEPAAIRALERAIAAGGDGAAGRAKVADKVAYTWFNRIVALRFMDANGYTSIGVVSPPRGETTGQPEVLADAKRGVIDTEIVNKRTAEMIAALLEGTRRSTDPQGEAFSLLLAEYCRYWHRSMPFMFEREGDYTELLIPANLLADDSVLARAVTVLTPAVCQDVEVIGWLYQFYISDRKAEVFAGFKKNKKAGADEIPAATQLFTPHWIVRYLVENSLGRLWMLNHPGSRLVDQMDYYIAPVDEEADFLKITRPEDLTVIDPACGSGHMLTYAFDLLYAIYEEQGYAPSEIPGLILTHNLYGTEIDPRAGALAAFALTMKARARQRTFFSKRIEPNICVLDPIAFSAEELDFLVTSERDRRIEEAFWNQFSVADVCGALVPSDEGLARRLGGGLAERDEEHDLLKADMLYWAGRVVHQATYLSRRYAVAIANPPYMGSRNFSPLLSAWAGRHYPKTRTDMYAMFIERCLGFLLPGGLEALVTMETWMFIRSYEVLRSLILRSHKLEVMAHLGSHAFDAIQGELVGTAAFVIAKGQPSRGHLASFVRLAEIKGEAGKSDALRKYSAGMERSARFDLDPSIFLSVDGQPLAYWLPEPVSRLLAEGRTLGTTIDFPSSPHKTGDNGRFLRKWWEVDAAHMGISRRWVPYAKGGGSRRWAGLIVDVVDWSSSALEFYRTNSSSSLMKRDPSSPAGITYSMLTMGANTFRVLPPGCAYDMGGPGFFATALTVPQVLGVANSTMAATVLGALNPTINLQTRDIKKIPLPSFSSEAAAELDASASAAIALSGEEWDESETSMGFMKSPIVLSGHQGRLSEIVSTHVQRDFERKIQLHRVEERISDLVWEAAGVDAVPYRNHRAPASAALSSESNARTREAVEDLVSYAVGCMFGRYSLDLEGLVLTDQGATLQDYLAKVPSPTFMPDRDNVIPIVDGDWFEDDIVGRFRQFLRAAFGEQHFEENLRFVTELLGVTSLRDYFVKSFYKDQVQRYKKRPIYWLFSSPKGSFNALIYVHRYTPSTVSTVLNEYLREFQAKLQASLAQAERSNKARDADRLRKVLVELNEYEHDVLYPLATQQIAISLDDGVKANYAKFGAALKKIPGLEADDE